MRHERLAIKLELHLLLSFLFAEKKVFKLIHLYIKMFVRLWVCAEYSLRQELMKTNKNNLNDFYIFSKE